MSLVQRQKISAVLSRITGCKRCGHPVECHSRLAGCMVEMELTDGLVFCECREHFNRTTFDEGMVQQCSSKMRIPA
jgi:hypothetical protein